LERLPELSLDYTKLYQDGVEKNYRPPGPGRNYMGEVLDAINRTRTQQLPDTPA
jgi:hypothetical protein